MSSRPVRFGTWLAARATQRKERDKKSVPSISMLRYLGMIGMGSVTESFSRVAIHL